MKEHVSRLEFRAKLGGDASISIPAELARTLKPGQRVLVSIDPRPRRASGGLHSDEEVERIARLQAEPAEAVRKCLDAQGSLARSPGIAALLAGRKPGRAG